MIKLTAFAIGLLTVVSTIAPNAQALQANVYPQHSMGNVPVTISGDRSDSDHHQRQNSTGRRSRFGHQQIRQHRRYGYRSLRNYSYDLGRGNRSNGYYSSNNGRVTENRNRNNHRGIHRDRN
jgi:hypothetical protein